MNKPEIIVTHAASNENEIIFYLSSRSNSYVKGTYANEGKSIAISIENENKDLSNKEASKLSIIMTILLLILNASFFIQFLSLSMHFCLAFILSTSIPLLFILYVYKMAESRLCPSNKKMNNTATHMIANFIRNHQKLPIFVAELRKSSRFHKGSNDFREFKDFIHFSIYLYVSLLVYAIFVFANKGISLQEKVFTSIILVVIIILLKLSSYWLNFFLQLSNTTSHINDDALYLAYFVAREWISQDYPEYLSEEWMQNSEFLNSPICVDGIDSQEASNI